jgi:hypothetical protein
MVLKTIAKYEQPYAYQIIGHINELLGFANIIHASIYILHLHFERKLPTL